MPQFGLHDVDDSAAFVAAVVNRSGLSLSWAEREDLDQYLLIELWRRSLRYEGSQGSRFSAWARSTLPKRIVDWQRKSFGRRTWKFRDHVYERPVVVVVSLDDPDFSSLGEALATDNGDPATVWDEACRGLYEDRDRTRVQDLECLGLKEAC